LSIVLFILVLCLVCTASLSGLSIVLEDKQNNGQSR
jgi:Na+-transporting NADH:ubiquinone oxidoreductase subunit NqrC